jgi:chloride channel protein, CIC family
MMDPQVQRKPYLRLILLALVLGLVTALITFAFVSIVHILSEGLWDDAAEAVGVSPAVFALVVCSLGGLLVGIFVRIFGDHNGIFADVMAEFGRTGRFDYRNSPGILLTAIPSLVAGGSLGPEAPLADASGGLGTIIGDRLKLDARETRTLGFTGVSGMLAAFITSPINGAVLGLESAKGAVSGIALQAWVLFPSLLSSSVAVVVFVGLSGHFFGTLYVFPDYEPALWHLFAAIPMGLLGGVVGVLFFTVLRGMQRALEPMKAHVVWRGLLGGLGLGIAGAVLPLTLFSGEDQTVELINTAAEIGVATLIALAVVKALVTCLCLATGWKGGYVFPIMFVSVALGLALDLIFPGIPLAVAVAATLGGALVATFQAPLFAVLFTLVMDQAETAPVVAIAVVCGGLLTGAISLARTRNSAPAPISPDAKVEPVVPAEA